LAQTSHACNCKSGFDELLTAITGLPLFGHGPVAYRTGMIHGPAAVPLAFDRRQS
jgi:hypothetical protein